MIKEDRIEFVSYDGKYPNFCLGTFVAKINGDVYHFHYTWEDKKKDLTHKDENWCPPFWSPGGRVCRNGLWDTWKVRGKWEMACYQDRSAYPEIVLKNRDRLLELFNENVPQGCCGGCI